MALDVTYHLLRFLRRKGKKERRGEGGERGGEKNVKKIRNTG